MITRDRKNQTIDPNGTPYLDYWVAKGPDLGMRTVRQFLDPEGTKHKHEAHLFEGDKAHFVACSAIAHGAGTASSKPLLKVGRDVFADKEDARKKLLELTKKKMKSLEKQLASWKELKKQYSASAAK